MAEALKDLGDSKDLRFFRTCITVMAVILVSGFIVQLATGRSSFSSPIVVHIHAVVFMGWVVIFVTQAWLAAAKATSLHRLLGTLAVFWACMMLVIGTLTTVEAVRGGRVPFFFQPQHFLLADPATLLGFGVLLAAAVTLRRRQDWHTRLQVGAFVMLLGPGLGRLLPMPLLAPYAFEIAAGLPVIILIVGMLRDLRAHKRIHPAWLFSSGVLLAVLIAARVIAFSPAGDALYAAATSESSMQGSDGRAFPAPPPH